MENPNLKPNAVEKQFLDLAYNRFYDLYDLVRDDSYWEKSAYERYSVLRDGFQIYTELLKYEPLKYTIEAMKTARPPMEAEIGSDVFKCFRNVISHFPFFSSWDEIFVTKALVNWEGTGPRTIDKFLENYKGKPQVKYRIWDPKKKKMLGPVSINFPSEYGENKIFLKDILSENEGTIFSFALMRGILDTQVEQ